MWFADESKIYRRMQWSRLNEELTLIHRKLDPLTQQSQMSRDLLNALEQRYLVSYEQAKSIIDRFARRHKFYDK